MNNLFIEALMIFVLLIANGVLALAELAVVSSRKARLKQQANKGNENARKALELANNPAEFLSTVQVGITLVGILAGVFGGATITEELAVVLSKILWLQPYSEAVAVGIVVVMITYLSLVVGELVPKRLALNNPERAASLLASPMQALSHLMRPAVRFLNASTGVVLRLLGVSPSTEPPITKEEIKILIEQGTQVGVIEEEEQEMIKSVLRMGNQTVGALMTPRTQLVWLDIKDTPQEIGQKITQIEYSIYPVREGDEENIVGVVYAKDLLAQVIAGQPLDLKSAMKLPLLVPESTLALDLLELFKQQGIRAAIVIDEYGSVQGMVAHDDVLEAIVGDISTTGKPEEPEIYQRQDGSWLLDGLLPVEKLKEICNIETLPAEEQVNYQTVGGFIMSQLGSIPAAGSQFKWGRYRFEVMDMDGRRVDKVLVTPLDGVTPPGGVTLSEDEAV